VGLRRKTMLELNKIYHADCLDLMREIPDKSIDMILCDLPYGTTACNWDVVIPFEPLWGQYERIIKDNGAIVLTASQPFTSILVLSNLPLFKYELIWDKIHPSNPYLAKIMPLKVHENILIFYKSPPTYNQIRTDNNESRKTKLVRNGKHFGELYSNSIKKYIYSNDGTSTPVSVLTIMKDTSNCSNEMRQINSIHPTQKPIALFEYLIKTYANENELVLDNCSGSGTTAIACHNLNRNFICIELDEEYHRKSIERYNKHIQQLKLL
jgi:site-specific DNA-methyltransferase (adenine-specific)